MSSAKAIAKSKELESKSKSDKIVDCDWENESTSILAVLDASSGEPDACELPEAGASMLIVLLIKCEWCSLLDIVSKPSERLLVRDDLLYGVGREKACGEGIATQRLESAGKSP